MEMFIMMITIFVLAGFVGVEIINKVPPTLHTPLMSGTNAIGGIVVVGAIISSGGADQTTTLSTVLGVVAVALATINMVAGFMVTDRMLQMFKKKK